MYRLAKLGFTQSYTYFTWRNTKRELTEYFTELTQTDGARVLPPEPLAEHAGHPAPSTCSTAAGRPSCSGWSWPRRSARATASTARRSSCCEHAPREPGSEEYLDSEKYELRHWDLDRAGQPARADRAGQPHPPREPGAAARPQPALPPDRQRAAHLLQQDDARTDERRPGGRSTSIPHHAQSGWVDLDLEELGLEPDAAVPGARPAHRRALPLARAAQLRRARSARGAGAHLPGPPAGADRAGLRLLHLRRCDDEPMSATRRRCRAPTSERRSALVQGRVIYELHVRAFARQRRRRHRRLPRADRRSSTTCRTWASPRIWLLPFYPSPLRDDGYDIADYTERPSRLRHARATSSSFLREAHRRGLRSSPSWSSTTPRTSTPGSSAPAARRRAARRATSTSGATRPSKYADARIIFKDFEPSNWTWDPVAKRLLLAPLLLATSPT